LQRQTFAVPAENIINRK